MAQGEAKPDTVLCPFPPFSPLSLCESEVAIETKYVHSDGGVTGQGMKGKRLRRNTIVLPCCPDSLSLNKAHSPHPFVRPFRPFEREGEPFLRNIWPILCSAAIVPSPSEWRLRPAWRRLAFDGPPLPSLLRFRFPRRRPRNFEQRLLPSFHPRIAVSPQVNRRRNSGS